MGETDNSFYPGIKSDRIDRPIKNETIAETITSVAPFFKRVGAMLQRTTKMRAESSFIILTKGKKLIFGKLKLGTSRADGFEDISLGLSTDYAQAFEDDHEYSGGRTGRNLPWEIAFFHIHPRHRGFSNADIAFYDEKRLRVKKEQVFEDQSDIEVSDLILFDQKALNIGYHMGLLIPDLVIDPITRKYMINHLTVLVVYGSPNKTEYQTPDFEKLSVDQQITLLVNCGFKVLRKDFPVVNNQISQLDKNEES